MSWNVILCLWLLRIWFIFSARAGSEKSKIAWEFRGMSRAISFGSQWVKMVAIKKFSCQKNKSEGDDASWLITRRANAPNGTFLILFFATLSLLIHVEFLNNKRRKEKDRWCRRLHYWLNLSYYWQFFMSFSLLICWLPIGDFAKHFFSLAMATKMVAAWSADVNGCFLTGGRTNRLDRQIVSENKIAKGMNKFFNE